MKEKTADTEGHRIKVDLDQHKSTSSSSSADKASSQPADSAIRISSKETTSKSSLFGVSGSNNNQSNNINNGGNSSGNNNNFDDDYNEWDISIGDLIIDLDADIERQSEGDKNPANCASPVVDPKTLLEGTKPATTAAPPNTQLFPEIGDSVSVMSSNLKSNRSSSLSSGASASAHSSLNASNSSCNLISASAPTSNAPNTNGTNSGPHTHHHGHTQRNAYSLSVNSTVATTANSSSSSSSSSTKLPNSVVEHQATVDKGLKMKIKRKSIGGKISETKHEIVSSDISPQALKPFIAGAFDPNSTNSTPNVALNITTTNNNKSPDPNQGSNSSLNSSNSVIITSVDGAPPSSLGDVSVLLAKSSKHSNKNKSAHRDKKDKSKIDKEKNGSPIAPGVGTGCVGGLIKPVQTDEPHDTTTLVPPNQSGIPSFPNLTLKYSATSSTVILNPEESNKDSPSNLSSSSKKIKTDNIDENISEKKSVGTSTSISTITEPDCLGPCEPGTNVTLEGIVWQETEGGVLVVNVTWRGKTYVGTLMDSTKYDWAPPRFCESPTSDIESKSLKNTRGKRARNNFATDNSIDTRSVTSKLRNGKGRRTANSGYVPPSPAKSDSSLNSSKRKGRPGDLDLTSMDDITKRNRVAKPETPDGQTPCSPVLIECPEPNCSKKYKHINGLKYHQSHAHIGSNFNINDSQEYDNVNSESNALGKDDISDGELNDSSLPDFNLKDGSNCSDKSSDGKTKVDICDGFARAEKMFTNNTQAIIETTKLNSSANEQLASRDSNQQVSSEQQQVDIFDLNAGANNTTGSGDCKVPINAAEAFDEQQRRDKSKVSVSDTCLSHLSGVPGAVERGQDPVNNSRNVIFSSNGIDLSPGLSKPSLDPSKSINNSTAVTKDDVDITITNVASPAYSDISDDTNSNEAPNELVTIHPPTQPQPPPPPPPQPPTPLEKGDPPLPTDLKKSQTVSNFSLAPFQPFYSQSPYLHPGNGADLKGAHEGTPKTVCESIEPSTIDLATEKSQTNPYSHFYRSFSSMLPIDSKSTSENLPKPTSGSLHSHPTSSPTNVKKSDSGHFHKDKSSESTKPATKENNNDFNVGKQPIVELQNLKNRIQNYAFDQGSLYDTQKRFIQESEREREREKEKMKEKTKHSPPNVKPTPCKEEKEKSVPVKNEGVKPTMETTGPPPPTNGYYYNPTFMPNLPHPFPAMSPFESMFRANAMVMGSPYGPPPGPSFLHSQMRFPTMGGHSLEGLSMPNVARTSSSQSPSSGPSTSTTSTKSSGHHHLSSSSFTANSKPDRTILSPTANNNSSNHHLNSSNSYHKSPNKEFPGTMIPSSHGMPASSASDPRISMALPSSAQHPLRHPLHSASHGYPIFDPYSAMMVNHASNSVPMHPFAPK